MAQRLTWKQEFASLILDDAQEERAMALKLRHFPRRLYRYGRFDDRGHWQALLLKHTLWLSSPRYFNDPYDCALLMDDAIIDGPAFRKVVSRSLRSLHGDCFTAAQEQSLGEAPDIAVWLENYYAHQGGDRTSRNNGARQYTAHTGKQRWRASRYCVFRNGSIRF